MLGSCAKAEPFFFFGKKECAPSEDSLGMRESASSEMSEEVV